MKARSEGLTGQRFRVKPLLIGALVAVLIGAACLLLSALLMTFLDLSQSTVTILSVLSAALGAFVGGMCAARLSGCRGWLMGAICGLFLFVLILLTGVLLHRSVDIGFLFIKLMVLLLGGMTGGMIGVNRK